MKEVQQLSTWIQDHKPQIKSKHSAIIKDLDSDNLALRLAAGLRQVGVGTPSFTAIKSDIGKLALQGVEDLTMSETLIGRQRLHVGGELLRVLFNEDKLYVKKTFDDKNKKKSSYKLFITQETISQQRRVKLRGGAVSTLTEEMEVDNHFINELIYNLPLEALAIHTFPVLFKPDPVMSFSSREAGQLVHKINRVNMAKFSRKNCPLIYDIANKQNTTPFIVNKDLLDFFNSIQEDDLFTMDDITIDRDNYHSDYAYSQALLELGKAKTGKRRENNMSLHEAHKIGDRLFYVFHYLDFRQRLYCSSHFLNYQQSKMQKSLFYFANGKELGAKGWDYLLLSACNHYGEDKLPLQDRIQFAEDHLDEWMVWAEDPKKYLAEIKDQVDDVFGFVGHILEISKAIASGDEYSFVSGLPIAIDMTCSGLAILSALSKDEESAKFGNISGSIERGDYYLHVASDVWKKLKASDDPKASFWISLEGSRRSICKRSAMTFFYNCQEKTMGDHIYEDHKWNADFNGMTKAHCQFISKLIYESCVKLMPGVALMMKLFGKMGQLEADKNNDFSLISDTTGFTMIQNYRRDVKGNLEFWYKGKKLQLSYYKERGKFVRVRKVKTATAPNIVHFLDAQIVAGVILASDFDLLTIHDSFSACPADADKLFHLTRKVFVDMFKGDALLSLLEQKEMESLIDTVKMGELDVELALTNQYFLS